MTQALDFYARQHTPNLEVLQKARSVATLMFQKGQGDASAYYNDFKHSAGHVLGYTFLALEAQWEQTPDAHKAEAQRNGMTNLIEALQSGEGFCDTRLCEEVMQVIGLPLSVHALTQPEALTIATAPISDSEAQDAVFAEAKKVLGEILPESAQPMDAAPPAAWRDTLMQRIERDHPNVTPEQMTACLEKITSDWPTFHDLVVEQRASNS